VPHVRLHLTAALVVALSATALAQDGKRFADRTWAEDPPALTSLVNFARTKATCASR
jgi:hypothetical protein